MGKLNLNKFKSFGNADIRNSAHLKQEDVAEVVNNTAPKLKSVGSSRAGDEKLDFSLNEDTAAENHDQKSMLKDESVPAMFAPAKLKRKISPKRGVPIGTIGDKHSRRGGISPVRGGSPVPPPGGRRGISPRRGGSPVPSGSVDFLSNLKSRGRSRGRSFDSSDDDDIFGDLTPAGSAEEAESLFQDVRSLLNPVRRASTMKARGGVPSRRVSLPPVLNPKPKFQVALKKRRPSIPTKLPSEVSKEFHIPYLKKVSQNFHGPGKGGPGYGPLQPTKGGSKGGYGQLKPTNKGGAGHGSLKPSTPRSSSRGGGEFRLPQLRHIAKNSPPSKGEGGAFVTLKRVPRNTPRPKEGEGELVLLKPVSKKLLPPNQNEKESVILKPIPRNAPLPPEEEGELAIMKIRPRRFQAPDKDEGEVIHLKPIPKKYQPPNEEGEMITLKPIPRKTVPIKPEGERVMLKRIPRNAPLPSEKDGEVVLLKPIPKKFIPPNEEAREAVVLKPISRNSPPPKEEEGELVLLKPIPKKSLPPKEEEGEEVVVLKPIPKKYLPPEEQECEVVTLKPIPPKALEEEEEEEQTQPQPKPLAPMEEPAPTEEPLAAAEEPAAVEELAPAMEEPAPAAVEEPASVEEPAPAPKKPAPSPPPPKEEKPVATPKPAPTPAATKPAASPSPAAAPQTGPAAAAAAAAEEDDGRVVQEDGTIMVRTADVYMAFNIPECFTEPSDKDYTKLAKATQKFFDAHLKKKFPSFKKVSVTKHKTYFGMNIPNDEYNVYVEWDVQAEFDGTSPDRLGLCQNLVKKTNLSKYMTKHLFNLFKSPWKQTDAVFIEQVNSELMEA